MERMTWEQIMGEEDDRLDPLMKTLKSILPNDGNLVVAIVIGNLDTAQLKPAFLNVPGPIEGIALLKAATDGIIRESIESN